MKNEFTLGYIDLTGPQGEIVWVLVNNIGNMTSYEDGTIIENRMTSAETFVQESIDQILEEIDALLKEAAEFKRNKRIELAKQEAEDVAKAYSEVIPECKEQNS